MKKNKKMKSFYKKGISMIEVIIMIVIIGIIVAVAIPQFSGMKRAQVLKSASQDIFSTLNKARSQSISSLDSSSYGVHFQSDKVVLFKGILYSAGSSDNQDFSIINPATVSLISLSGGAVDVYFDRLTGLPNVSGNINVSVPGNNLEKIITISNTGAIGLN